MDFDQIVLAPDEIPTKWYNIVPDIPGGLPPPMEPGDGESRMARKFEGDGSADSG